MHDLPSKYSGLTPNLAKLESEVLHQLESLLGESGVTLANPVEHRIKSLTSIQEKIQRKSLHENVDLQDLPDLVGFRIVLVFLRDMTKVKSLIENSLDIVSSEDTATRLTELQFGYQSFHYIGKIPKAWSKIPSFKELGDLRFEIQVRTAAQHIWAAASHKLQYKVEMSIPSPLRRAIHRVAALLETVDLEFERVLNEREDYEEEVTQVVPEELNVVSLKKLLDALWPQQNLDSEGEIYADLVSDLKTQGITDLKNLRHLIEMHRSATLEIDEDRSDDDKFTHVGLTRVALEQEFGSQWFDHPRVKRKKANLLHHPSPRSRSV